MTEPQTTAQSAAQGGAQVVTTPKVEETLGVTPKVQPPATPPAKPEAEEGDAWEPNRAMSLIEKLREENKALKAKAKKGDELEAAEKARTEAEMTELQKAQKRLAELEAEVARSTRAELRRKVAEQVKLPASLADRLQGESEADLLEDAKALLALITPAPGDSKQTKPQPVLGVTNPAGAQQGETLEQKRARLLGRPGYAFDPDWAKSHGGGVITPTEK